MPDKTRDQHNHQTRPWHKLRWKLIAVFVVLVAIPAALIAVTTILQINSQVRVQAIGQLEAVLELKRSQVELWLREGQAGLSRWMGDPAHQFQISQLVSAESGSEIFTQEVNTSLAEFTEAHPYLEELFVYDNQGRIVAASDSADVGKVVSRRSFFRPSLATIQHIAPPVYDVGLGQIALIMTHQTTAQDGTATAVLAGRLDISTLGTIMTERVGLGETGETYVVSLDNSYLLTPSRFEGYQTNRAYSSDGITRVLQGESGTGAYENYQEPPVQVLGAYRWMPELQIGILAEINEAEALALPRSTINTTLVISLVTVLGATVIGFWYAGQIAGPIESLTHIATSISKGNLGQRANNNLSNEIGQLARTFNEMADTIQQRLATEQDQNINLRRANEEIEARALVEQEQREYLMNLFDQIRSISKILIGTSTEVKEASAQQLSSAVEQDAAVNQTMATVEEVRTTVSLTAERAQTVAKVSQQALSVSQEGQDAVRNTIEGMEKIRQQVEDIAQTILELSERTQHIGQIIEAVNALAEQSKLLALNASIEAARAGEEGKGFAVVAMEVRQLADQSRTATAQVNAILSEIQQATNSAVMITEEGSKGTEAGMTLVERAGETIYNLTIALEDASRAATEIATSTRQQIDGMDQLVTAIAQIKQASIQSSASSMQTEQSILNIVGKVSELEESVTSYQALKGIEA